MKYYSSLVALALASVAAAQAECAAAASALPSCGATCIVSVASQVGCVQGDLACQCQPSNMAAIQTSAINCVLSACGQLTGLAVQQAALGICSCVSAHPSTASPSTTAGSSSASVSASTTVSTTKSSTTVESTISSTGSNGVVSTTVTSSTSVSTSARTTTSGPSQNAASSTTSASSSSSTAGAQVAVPWVGGSVAVLAGFGGLIAIL